VVDGPAAKTAARRIRGSKSTSTTSTGTIAQASTAPPNPNAAPPQASRLVLAEKRSPSNSASAPSRQNSASHGSTSTVWAAATESG